MSKYTNLTAERANMSSSDEAPKPNTLAEIITNNNTLTEIITNNNILVNIGNPSNGSSISTHAYTYQK